MWKKALMAVGWPAFLTACLLEVAVFALVDPHELNWGGGPVDWSRQAVYTAAFFVFWASCLLSSFLALLMSEPVRRRGI